MIPINFRLAGLRCFSTFMKHTFLIFSALLVTGILCLTTKAEQIQTYTVADGLTGPVVPVIFQDSRGNLWFGSDRDGVSRFDGTTFDTYIGHLDTSEYAPTADVGAGALLGQTLQIVEDKWGHLWFLTRVASETSGRISRFDGTSINLIGTGNSLLVDRYGDVWVGENQQLTKYITAGIDNLPQAHPNEIVGEDLLSSTHLAINVIFESKDGTLWIGGMEADQQDRGVILSFRENLWTRPPVQSSDTTEGDTPGIHPNAGFVRYDISDLNAVGAIETINQDASGYLWFGGNNFLLRFDGEAFEQVLPSADGVSGFGRANNPSPVRKTASILSDTQQRVWFSDGQISRWSDGDRHGTLTGFLELEDAWGYLWFTDEKGAHQYNPDLTQMPDIINSELGIGGIHTIFEAIDGKLWFGHDNGVTTFDPTPAINTHAELGTNRVRVIFEDSRGYLWFSVPGGVARYDTELEELTRHTLRTASVEIAPENAAGARPPRTVIRKMFEVDGYVWFIDEPRADSDITRLQYNFFRYADGKFSQVAVSITTRISPFGMQSAQGTEVLIDEGEHTWLAFGGHVFKADATGLLQLTDTAFQRIAFQEIGTDAPPSARITVEAGLTAITDLYRDSSSRVWVHFADAKVLRYPTHINTTTSARPSTPEILPIQATELLKSTSKNKWFFNAVTGKLILWAGTEFDQPIPLDGENDSVPLAVWKALGEENKRISFLFADAMKTYHGTTLLTVDKIELAEVQESLTSQAGVLWLATLRGAVRYDGKSLRTYTTKDEGFLVDNMKDVMEDSRGNIWLATWGGGTVRYDGESFYNITTKDGLSHNNISRIHESSDKNIWFTTEGGVTHYTPTRGGLPEGRITSLESDKTYTDFSSGLTLPASGSKILNVQGISPLREGHSYEFKLIGLDTPKWTHVSAEAFSALATMPNEWRPAETSESTIQQTALDANVIPEVQNQNGILRIRYTGLTAGNYTFLVKTFRKDWPYTHTPTVVDFNVMPPIWAGWRAHLPTFIFLMVVFVLVGRLIVNRRHTLQLRNEVREREEAEIQRIRAELSEAQNIQMGLLPTEPPETEIFDIAGMSVPATQVGGDFYDYLTVANGQTAVAVADAAGKGLRGAMNAVLTNGMLYEVSRFKSDADVILTDLNAGLAPRMYGPSFIALNLAVLDENSKRVDYANGGQPYPVLKRGSEIIEIEISDLPLGGMKRVQYESLTFDLHDGDVLILHTDGLIEALNPAEEMYGTDRLNETVSKIPDNATAEEIIEHLVADVHDFVEEAEQYDDLTIVVIRIPEPGEENATPPPTE